MSAAPCASEQTRRAHKSTVLSADSAKSLDATVLLQADPINANRLLAQYKPMNTLPVFAALLAALALAACQKQPAEPLKPQVQQTPAMPMPMPMPSPGKTFDTSVPSAAAVLPPASETPRAATPAGRTNRTMSPTQESTAMPLPGQANDHSAPMAPASRASSP